MAVLKDRELTEEELFRLKKVEKQPEAKVIPMNSVAECVPVQAVQPTALPQPQPSWYKRNQTVLIIAGVVLAISCVIVWQDYQKRKKANRQL